MRILYNFCTHCNLKSAYSILAEIAKSTNTSGFCITHLFTYLDIPGIAGLAFHSKPNGIALCYPDANTGFTTFLNHQVLTPFITRISLNWTSLKQILLEPLCSKKKQKKILDQLLVCRIGDLWRFWMVQNWLCMIRGIPWTHIQLVWNHSDPSEVPYSANQ